MGLVELATSKWSFAVIGVVYSLQAWGYYRDGDEAMGFVMAMYALSLVGFWWSRP